MAAAPAAPLQADRMRRRKAAARQRPQAVRACAALRDCCRRRGCRCCRGCAATLTRRDTGLGCAARAGSAAKRARVCFRLPHRRWRARALDMGHRKLLWRSLCCHVLVQQRTRAVHQPAHGAAAAVACPLESAACAVAASRAAKPGSCCCCRCCCRGRRCCCAWVRARLRCHALAAADLVWRAVYQRSSLSPRNSPLS